MSAAKDHLETHDYPTFMSALVDADRVAADLERLSERELLIPGQDIEFLARRLRILVGACMTALEAEPPC